MWKKPERNSLKSAMHLTLICLMSATPTPLIATPSDVPESKLFLTQAQSAISRFLPAAELIFVDGALSEATGCEQLVEWKYVFQSVAEDGKVVAGYVAYSLVPLNGGGCKRKERVVIDTAMAPILGYYKLAQHGDLEMVRLEWPEALENAKKARAGFEWEGRFEIYSPLYPVFWNHVYYVLIGNVEGRGVNIVVDASSGEIEEAPQASCPQRSCYSLNGKATRLDSEITPN